MSRVTDEIRAAATEFYKGHDICQEKINAMYKKMELPQGLTPLKDIEEFGYVENTGFIWIKQKKKIEHKFEKIGKLTQYATEITGYIEKLKIKKLNGVKSKELMMWIAVGEIYIDEKDPENITFKSTTGLSKAFPVSAFE